MSTQVRVRNLHSSRAPVPVAQIVTSLLLVVVFEPLMSLFRAVFGNWTSTQRERRSVNGKLERLFGLWSMNLLNCCVKWQIQRHRSLQRACSRSWRCHFNFLRFCVVCSNSHHSKTRKQTRDVTAFIHTQITRDHDFGDSLNSFCVISVPRFSFPHENLIRALLSTGRCLILDYCTLQKHNSLCFSDLFYTCCYNLLHVPRVYWARCVEVRRTSSLLGTLCLSTTYDFVDSL